MAHTRGADVDGMCSPPVVQARRAAYIYLLCLLLESESMGPSIWLVHGLIYFYFHSYLACLTRLCFVSLQASHRKAIIPDFVFSMR